MVYNRRGFMWVSIILELSIVMGVVFYGLTHLDSHANEGGLLQPVEVEPFLPFIDEEALAAEAIVAEEDSQNGEGGPYKVAPLFHVSIYRAKNGDSLWSIANESGSRFYTLLSVNRLKKANDISIGQKLKIPNQNGVLHIVNKDETLEDIALKYDVGIRKIIRVNRILDPNEIKQGADLFVPGARITPSFSKKLLTDSGIPPQFDWPCRRSRISSSMGYRKDPFTGKRAYHSGIDYAPGYGTSVYASMDGIVTHAGWMGGYGKLIVIQHRNSFSTRYGHLSSILVTKGKRIRQGQRIGKVGSTGRSTGAHLHFEIRQNGKALNPRKFVR